MNNELEIAPLNKGSILNYTSNKELLKQDGYKELLEVERPETQRMYVIQYKESTAPTDTLKTAIGNMVDRKDIFTEAYTINVELPIVVYNTIALSIEASLSYLIAGSIDYIKTPDGSFEVSLNKTALKHSGQNLLFENLEKFNKSCASGEFDRTMKECIHSGAKNLVGAVTIFTAATVLALSKTIIPILQDCVYFFYHQELLYQEQDW